MPLVEADRTWLLRLARESIRHGLDHGRPQDVALEAAPPATRERRAAFVTLEEDGCLRGCIGSIEARCPLALDVAENAYAAAFEDPRFSPVRRDEVDRLDIHISVLTRPEPFPVADEADLLRRLRPGRDGLILGEGGRRATFLPAVWEDLPNPRDFVVHLKLKAGLSGDYWSDRMQVWRYETDYFPAPGEAARPG
jgi:hypothetical protein